MNRRICGILLAPSLFAGCSEIKTYPDTLPKNMHVRTETSKVRAELHIHRVDANCLTEYQGTVQLDKPSVEVGIPAGRQSLVAFTFSSSSFLTGSSTSVRYDTLLTPRAGYTYDVKVSYLDRMYNVAIREIDPRGRKQYRYHARHQKARDNSKVERMPEFSEILPQIRERVERDLRARDLTRPQILATVVMLLDKTLIRVGNDEYARENRSFGLTTLRDRHVEIKGAKMLFSFRGKSGVDHTVSITDRRLARIVQQCQDLPGYELFKYIDPSGKRQTISSDDVNAYLREITGRDITAKDFRTWAGTMLAARELFLLGPAKTQREAERNMIRAIAPVAKRLGNTRTVCRKYYVHPGLVRAYLHGLTAPLASAALPNRARREHPTAALRRDEVAVLQFLQEDAAEE